MSRINPEKPKSDSYRDALEHILWWCRQDVWNEDGYPTDSMLESRVNYVEEVLSGKSKVKVCK